MYKVIMIVLIIAIICDIVNSKSTYYYENQGDIVFPGPTSYQRPPAVSRLINPSTEQSFLAKSIALAKQMEKFNSVEDFLNIVKGVPESEKPSFIADRMGTERSSMMIAKPAICQPEYQVVPLKPLGDDRDAVYFPSCTRVKRCGGCCYHRLLSCQPVERVIHNYQITVTKRDNDSIIWEGKELIPVEEHIKCNCLCQITAEQCNYKQEYIENECRCVCLNNDDELKCKTEPRLKIWDTDKCECGCREQLDCHEGTYFDKNTCRCERNLRNRDSHYIWQGSERKMTPIQIADPRRNHRDEPYK
ncbi:vascular endothelial growth factor A-like [Microplitis mediator]|uniref:vascular endothelial growth factor A-like n=1 Tax=Microplitis mediator TaxID=375433 RepID=UPI002556297C|nr:vascular endothelial growth factor A-like [Microplitis mediator]